jgi:hypothetical protein
MDTYVHSWSHTISDTPYLCGMPCGRSDSFTSPYHALCLLFQVQAWMSLHSLPMVWGAV